MKTAQCKYSQAGLEITLNIYFDPKAFDFINTLKTREDEENFIRLTCDSMAAALPREKIEKVFYIKRIFKSADSKNLILLCTDGFLIDAELTLPITQQGYSNERIKLTEIEQLPSHLKLSNALLKSINEKLPAFEEQAKKISAQEKLVAAPKETAKQYQTQTAAREFTSSKALDVLSEISRVKKEIMDLADNNMKILREEKDKVSRMHDDASEKYKEVLIKKINELTPINEKFTAEAEALSQSISRKNEKLVLFKQYIINALYESAKQFHEIVWQKLQVTPSHARRPLLTDFNKKFADIASLSDSGELSGFLETQKNLEKLSLENLQEIISNDSKETPGLLQKCNTSWTEESPELQIVMKHLSKLNITLSPIFEDEPAYAHQEMTQIVRIPFPRSFQFKFTEAALNYKKVVDDYCKTQKETLMNLANHYKKILQITELLDKTNYTSTQPKVATKLGYETNDLQKRKEITDTLISLASKDHALTTEYRDKAKQLYDFVSTHIDSNRKSLTGKINASIERINTEAAHADTMMQELLEIKSQVDIKINHYLLHPEEKPDIDTIDQTIQAMGEKRHSLLTENKLLQDYNNKLAIYDNVIKRIKEVDLSVTQTQASKQRNEAKTFLLEYIQSENNNPDTNEAIKKRIIEQYSKVDNCASDLDKLTNELKNMQDTLLTDLDSQPDIQNQALENQFKGITQKIQALNFTLNIMNENVNGLKKLSHQASVERKK